MAIKKILFQTFKIIICVNNLFYSNKISLMNEFTIKNIKKGGLNEIKTSGLE